MNTSDHIRVERIAVFGRHGVLPEETALGQRFYISLDARLDLAPAGRADDIARTVSYADLAQVAAEIATARRFKLIEALAEAVAGTLLARFEALHAVTVRVEKPGAPVPLVLDTVSVEITRQRGTSP